jgi:heptosyltransferase III
MVSAQSMKILAIQFRYLGDAVILTPALRAVHEHFPEAQLHVLVPEEAVPLLRNLPWLTRVWGFPRKRGQANLLDSWPLIRCLRREKFERSVDFSTGDRSALLSLACGARERLGLRSRGGFLGRRLCYTRTLMPENRGHQALNNFRILELWNIRAPASPRLEIRADSEFDAIARQLLPSPTVIAHISTSQPRKEWPLEHWAELHRKSAAAGHELMFSTGTSIREQALLNRLQQMAPGLRALPILPDLAVFLAVLQRASLVICGCTGPLHFAAGLGVPTIGLFGPTLPTMNAPLGPEHQALRGGTCACRGTAVCLSANPCLAAITPEAVLGALKRALAAPS